MADAISRLNAALSGHYRVERQLGEGGMATVYLADDLKHGRKVALKVLKPELAAVVGAERFLAEIRTTANLQHPHILPLHDSGEADGLLYYVMPRVEGESLRERLEREHQLPVDEAVRIATNVAEALDYAHRHGVIHRDIKPANILLLDGKPVISDFGIALAVTSSGAGRLTETGLSLGTPHYMSPEQATGDQSVGAGTDVYALGCVLYEMLVGEPPYTGSTPQAVLGKIITAEPASAMKARRSVPPNVDAAIVKALEKVPADRFGSAGELARALEDRGFRRGPETLAAPGVNVEPPWRRLALGTVSIAIVSVGVAAWTLTRSSTAPETPGRYLNVALPDSLPVMFVGEHWSGNGEAAITLSPAGDQLAYVGPAGETTRLYVRSLADGTVRQLEGTEGAHSPAFSPDGESLAFFADDRLMMAPVDGGPVQPVVAVGLPEGPPTWADDGRIAFSESDGRRLMLVPPEGGAARAVVTGPPSISSPAWIPGTEWILYTCYDPRHICAASTGGDTRRLAIDGPPIVDDGETGRLMLGSDPRFVEPGYLVYGAPARNTLMGVRLDPETLEVIGPPQVLLEGLRREADGSLQVSVSARGDLVIARGSSASLSRLVWARDNGIIDTLPVAPGVYGAFTLSPDYRRLAVRLYADVGDTQLWFYDLERGGAGARWDMGPAVGRAVWAPGSDRVLVRLGSAIVQIDPRSPRGAVELGSVDTLGVPIEMTSDGRVLLVESPGLDEARLVLAPLQDLVNRTVRLDTLQGLDIPGLGVLSDLSPDGQWLAYTATSLSEREGTYEVYVRRLDETSRASRISAGMGESPRWSPRGDGLFYRSGNRYFWVPFSPTADEPFGEPRLFVSGNFNNVPGSAEEVSADGRALLLLLADGSPQTHTLDFIEDFRTRLTERLGPVQ